MIFDLPDATDLGESLAQAGAGLDAIVFPSEREQLHVDISKYLAFTDEAHDTKEQS